MRKIKQSTAKNIMVFMTDLTDHVSGKAGLTLTITASKNGAAFGSITPSVTERGNGWYNLALTAAHTDTLGDLAIHITSTGADPTDLVLEVVAYDPNDAAGLGLSRMDAAIASRAAPGAEMALIDGAITATKAPNLDAAISSRATPGAEMALIDGAITATKAPNLDAAISTRALESGGNVATIMGKTNNLPPDPADASDIGVAFAAVPGAVWGYGGGRTLSSFGTLIADIFGYVVEGSMTFLQSIRIRLASLALKSSGGGTTSIKFRDLADSKDRITATVDDSGNRTAVTIDGS